MKKIYYYIIPLFVVVMIVGYNSGVHLSKKDRFYNECVKILKERLKSPSSYQLTSVKKLADKKLDIKDLMNWNGYEYVGYARNRKEGININRYKDRLEREDVFLSTLFIKYEAENIFGTSIGATAICTTDKFDYYFSLISDGVYNSVRVDGMTDTEWLLKN